MVGIEGKRTDDYLSRCHGMANHGNWLIEVARYRGESGFKRKDHLAQHIRNYHHIDLNAQDPNNENPEDYSCTFEGCEKTGFNAFESEKLLKAHLKKEHPSPYQCSYPGCHRIGTKGWMRERDMVKHMRKEHDV